MSSKSEIGASGTVIIVAPLPVEDSAEEPLLFVAITFAITLSPNCKEYGALVKADLGIRHYVAARIVLSEPRQFTVSSVKVDPSLC